MNLEKIDYINGRLSSKVEHIGFIEYKNLKESEYCNIVDTPEGILVYRKEPTEKLIYVYYAISYKKDTKFIKSYYEKYLKENYIVTCSVCKTNKSLIKFYERYLGMITSIHQKEESNFILMSSSELTDKQNELVTSIKEKLHNIVSKPFKVVFDLDDTLIEIDEPLFKRLGLPLTYNLSNAQWSLLDKYYNDPNTYNVTPEVNMELFKQLAQMIKEENIIIYSHCLSLEIAQFKYNFIKEHFGSNVSIVFSFDEKKPPIECDVVFEDSLKNLDLYTTTKYNYHIKRFYNDGTYSLNGALSELINTLLREDNKNVKQSKFK